MGLKLKKGGNSTPSPTWKIGSFDIETKLCLPNINTNTASSSVSARKLGACLWEALPPHTAEEKMSHGATMLRRRRRRKGKDKGLKVASQIDAALDSPYEEPPRPSDSSFKREIAASLIKNHSSFDRISRSLQPVSPASYNSSMEVAPFNPPLSPHSFRGLEGKVGNSPFNLKTSKELVMVLNRIWSLEEQHASNISLVNSMKKELDQSHVRIQVLLREKNKEQERVKAIIKSLREELEDERKLRKQSESLHRKLARELSDTKASFADTLKAYERERKARSLLEDLCDEFAKGIRDYEQEVRHLKHKPDKDLLSRESPDRLILHLSEAWLDERMQMKQDDAKGSIVDKLSIEIETFLQAKVAKQPLNSDKLSVKMLMGRSLQKHSLESIHMNEATSAPHNAKDDDDSTGSDLNCIECHLKEKPKMNTKKKGHSQKKQGKFEGIGNLRVKSNRALDKLIRDRILSLEEETLREDNEVLNATAKWARGLKESTLKAKLLEARLEGQHSHLKAFQGSA